MQRLFEKAQKFGKAFMLPIAILPAAGLLLGIGGALSNPNTVASYPFLDVHWLQSIFTVMSITGAVVFSNLAVLFAIGIAVGLARTDKGTAGLAAFIAYIVMNATINAVLNITGHLAIDNIMEAGQGMTLGIQTLETGVLGGILAGVLAAYLHNRYNKTQLPAFLGFFSGSRFVPIICSFGSIFLGLFLFLVWPSVQSVIMHAGGLVQSTGPVGTFVYGFILRMLGPLGLHHLFYMPFWVTGLGGSEIVNGVLVEGTQKIFFAQLADPTVTKFYEGTSRFMAGRFGTMMFGLPGAALAIYLAARPENRKRVAGLMGSAALTSFLTGITEPLEFAFLFVAPILYLAHALMDGLSFMLADIFQITIGQTFSGGAIDFMLFGVLQGEDKTHWTMVPLVGALLFVLYFAVFSVLIRVLKLNTPGREPEEAVEEISVDKEARAAIVLENIGGAMNIEELDCCATRLRLTVKNPDIVDKEGLRAIGAKGVIVKGKGVQVIFGPEVSVIKNEMEEILGI
jgi:PTS system maltose and glucose-specific IIC component